MEENKNKIIEWIKKELDSSNDKKYIKNGWFDGIGIDLFEYKKNDKDLSIIDCIKNCTSPRISENKDITEEDLELIFKAFSLFKPEDTRVLILGQDPYPDNDNKKNEKYGHRANGLAFSFKNGQEPADDSLLNIFNAIVTYREENGIAENNNISQWDTNLETWARNNGILLLNTSLTFESKDNPHFKYWNDFIKNIIKSLIQTKLNNNCNNLAIFLWGEKAQNIFFESLNDIITNNEIIKNFIKKDDLKIAYKNKSKFKKINRVIRKDEFICLSKNIKLYLTNHPSFISENNNGKFVEYSSKFHFKDSDEFLEDEKGQKLNIWKNFPEK